MDTFLRPETAIGGSARHKLMCIDREASVLEASKLMRKAGATELLVVDTSSGAPLAFGILTTNDIVARVIAAELDPAVMTAGDIVWSELAASSATTSSVI